jgi:hypothetical protein
MIGAYYCFSTLSDEVKANYNIRSTKRLDCTNYYAPIDDRGITKFVNSSKSKSNGMLHCYLNSPRYTKADLEADYSLSFKYEDMTYNLSTILYDCSSCLVGFGAPMKTKRFRDAYNPLYTYRSDGYLFYYDELYTKVEVIIIPRGRNDMRSIYQQALDGEFDDRVNEMRSKAKPIFNYTSSSTPL